jgi:hypothetical protein
MGLKMLVVINGLPKAVKSNGAVSPITLEILKITPVRMPLNPVGTMTFSMVL